MDGRDRPRSNLGLRVATAAVGIPLVLLVDYLGGAPFAVVVALVAAVAAGEAAGLLRESGVRPLYIINIPAAAIFAALPLWLARPQGAWVGIGVACFALAGGIVLSPALYSASSPSWLLSPFPALYTGVLLGHLHLLRQAHHGAWWVGIILLITWGYDTGAYFAGSYFGSHPFMQHVSPRKTREGVLGGLCLSALVALVAVPALGLAPWQAVCLGVAGGAVAQLGDLIESMLKRQVGVKDSGHIVPGHGGLLDRIDSLLLTGALGYYASALLGYAS